MTFLDKINTAKALVYYQPPGKPSISDYTEEEVFYAMLAHMLKDRVIIYGIIAGCEKHFVVKVLVNALLKKYITKYT